MVIGVVEFSSGGYKIRNLNDLNAITTLRSLIQEEVLIKG